MKGRTSWLAVVGWSAVCSTANQPLPLTVAWMGMGRGWFEPYCRWPPVDPGHTPTLSCEHVVLLKLLYLIAWLCEHFLLGLKLLSLPLPVCQTYQIPSCTPCSAAAASSSCSAPPSWQTRASASWSVSWVSAYNAATVLPLSPLYTALSGSCRARRSISSMRSPPPQSSGEALSHNCGSLASG